MTRHVCLLAALPLVAILPTLPQSPSLTVAIVRPDGYLVPFAAYANGRWERAWPAADEGNLESAEVLERPELKDLVDAAVAQARAPFRTTGRGKLIIRSVSATQRPRQVRRSPDV